MPEFLPRILIAGLACGWSAASVFAQTQTPILKQVPDPAAATRQAVSLAERGRCQEALPVLKRNMAHLADKELRYRAGMAAARCAMSIDDAATAVDALVMLRRDFPNDPEVLYICTHFYSQLANRSAQALAEGFPTSSQVSKLNAEALESAQKWDEAIAAYRQILAQNPGLPEIHYRIASIMLDRASDAETAAEAKKELEEELKINPESAVAEFALGEIARRAGDWDVAIQHFSRTAKLDEGLLKRIWRWGCRWPLRINSPMLLRRWNGTSGLCRKIPRDIINLRWPIRGRAIKRARTASCRRNGMHWKRPRCDALRMRHRASEICA